MVLGAHASRLPPIAHLWILKNLTGLGGKVGKRGRLMPSQYEAIAVV